VLLSASPTSSSSGKADSSSFSSSCLPSTSSPSAPPPRGPSSAVYSGSESDLRLVERLNIADIHHRHHHLNFLLIFLLLPPSPSAVGDKRKVSCILVSVLFLPTSTSFTPFAPTSNSAESANWCGVVCANILLLRFIILAIIITKAPACIRNDKRRFEHFFSKEQTKQVKSRWWLSNNGQDNSDSDATVRCKLCHFRPWKEGTLSHCQLDFSRGDAQSRVAKLSSSISPHLNADADEGCWWKVQFLNCFNITVPIATTAHCYYSECCNKDRPTLVYIGLTISSDFVPTTCLLGKGAPPITNRRYGTANTFSSSHSLMTTCSLLPLILYDSILHNKLIVRSSFIPGFWILHPRCKQCTTLHHHTAVIGKNWACFNSRNECCAIFLTETSPLLALLALNKISFFETLNLNYFYDWDTIQSQVKHGDDDNDASLTLREYCLDKENLSLLSPPVESLVWCVRS